MSRVDEPEAPQSARAHDPLRPLEEPNIFGPQPSRTDSTAPDTTGATYATGSQTAPERHSEQTRRSKPAHSHDPTGKHAPIGMLAARKTPYSKKAIWKSKKARVWIPLFLAIGAVVAIPILYFPVAHAIANHLLSVAVLEVSEGNITNITDSGFSLTVAGGVGKGGILPGHAYPREPVEVYWTSPSAPMDELFLGSMPLAMIGIANGRATINQMSYFTIGDYDAFLEFAQYLIQTDEFTWRMRTKNVQVKALGFVTINGVGLEKDVTIKGVANLTDIFTYDFQITGDSPDGGAVAFVGTQMTNPSPFGIEIGYLEADMYFQNQLLGHATNVYPINLTAGINKFDLTANIPFFDTEPQLNALGVLATNYLNGVPTVVSVSGTGMRTTDNRSIHWLNVAAQALTIQASVMNPKGPFPVLQTLSLNQLDLAIDPDTAYAPTVNSSNLSGDFATPFGMSLKATQAVVNATMVINGTQVAQLDSPLVAPLSHTLVQTSSGTYGTVDMTMPNVTLAAAAGSAGHMAFDQFVHDLVMLDFVPFGFVGSAFLLADTAMGRLAIDGVNFAVSSGFVGLSGFMKYPAQVVSVDVTGGASQEGIQVAMTIGLTSTIVVTLNTFTPVTFRLASADKDDAFLGFATLPQLIMPTGYSLHQVVGTLYPNDNIVARAVLSDYISGVTTNISIQGFNGSSTVASLNPGLEDINMRIALPGLSQKLLGGLTVNVLTSTGIDDNHADGIAQVQNPFSAALTITDIQANATVMGLFLASVNQQVNKDAAGNTTTPIPLATWLNLYPPQIFRIVRELAIRAGESTQQLDGIMQVAGYQYADPQDFYHPHQSSPLASVLGKRSVSEADDHLAKRKQNIYTGFNIVDFVGKALTNLTIDLDSFIGVNIGGSQTMLPYSQQNIPTTVNNQETLVASLATPIVQRILDRASISINTATISNVTDSSFIVALNGRVDNAGPFDATLTAPTGLTISWNGKSLGQVGLPPVQIAADEGAVLDFSSQFTVADEDSLTDFTSYLLNEPSFTWQLSSPNLSVSALGMNVSGVSLMKSVTLRGMNGLKNDVKINSFDLPENNNAGGVSLTINSTIHNPSSIGINVDAIQFDAYFDNIIIGNIKSSGDSIVLNPMQDNPVSLAGRLFHQDNDDGINALSVIFDSFVHGLPSELVVQGTGASPSAAWLVNGIKQLRTGTVLPGAVDYKVITDFFVNDLQASFDASSRNWNPDSSTTNILAAFQLPFAFPIELVQVTTSIQLMNDSSAIAELNVPTISVTTNVTSRLVTIQFENVPLQASDHTLFQDFLIHLTDDESVTVDFVGGADAVTHSALGTVPLHKIPVNVPVNLLALQGLKAAQPNVSDIDVAHGYSDYLQINLNTRLEDPSHITLQLAGDTDLAVLYNGQQVGYAVISDLRLVPGNNVVPTQLHYQPSGSAAQAAGREFLEKYIDRTSVVAEITGVEQSTKIQSLLTALETLDLSVTILPLEQNLITQVSAYFPTTVGQDGVAQTAVVLSNPFDVQIQIVSLQAAASSLGYHIGNIDLDNVKPAISSPGHTATLSSRYPLLMETDKDILSEFVRAAASQNNVDLGILGTLLDMIEAVPRDTQITVSASGNPKPESCAPTGTTRQVQSILNSALQNLNVSITANTTTHLDDFVQDLSITQNDVPLEVDDSTKNLVGLVGRWIVPEIVDGVILTVSSAYIYNIKDTTMTVNVRGAATNASILDASLSFPEGVGIFYKSNRIATLELPDLCSTANKGIPDLNIDSPLSIDDQNQWTNFVIDILHSESFDWTLQTPRAIVYAAGTNFSNVNFNKTITLAAFNGLQNITITPPDLPGDAPNGIQLVTQGTITSPASVGIDIGRASFFIFFESQKMGEVTSEGLALQAHAATQTTLRGSIQKQSGKGLQALTDLVSPFLQGLNSTILIQGDEAITDAQPDNPVQWLSKGLQSLQVNITLPGRHEFPIDAIHIVDLEQQLLQPDDAYNVPTESNAIDVTFHNPFAFTLGIQKAGGDFYINYDGQDAGILVLPGLTPKSSEKSTGDPAALVIGVTQNDDVHLKSQNDDQFNTFYDVVTNTEQVNFVLHGKANVLSETNAGNFWINGLDFNVSSQLAGLSGLNTRPVNISDVQVVNGTQQYLGITANALLLNPSNITLTTNDVQLYLYFQNQRIGPAIIYYLPLTPGDVTVTTLVEYSPDASAQAAGQQMLNGYVSNLSQPVEIRGDTDSSPYGSLDLALSHVNLQGTLPPLNKWLITHADIAVPKSVAQTYQVDTRIYLSNPFELDLHIVGLSNATAVYKGFDLGAILLDTVDPPLDAAAQKVSELRAIPLTLNKDATVLVRFVLQLAQDEGQDLGILQQPLQQSLTYPENYGSEIVSRGNPNSESCNAGHTTSTVNDILTKLLSEVPVNISVYDSTLLLQDFSTHLPFNQYNVPASFKSGVLNLVSVVGKPIVAAIVQGVQLNVTDLYLSNVTNEGASVRLVGALLNTGPFDAEISFPNGIDVIAGGFTAGTIVNVNTVCAQADKGIPDLTLTGYLQVKDMQGTDALLQGVLSSDTYNLNVQSSNITVQALDQIFSNVPLNITSPVRGFRNFTQTPVTLEGFDAPGDSDAGIRITATAALDSISNVGLEISTAYINAASRGYDIAQAGLSQFNLKPDTHLEFPLDGTLIKSTDEAQLSATGWVLSDFLGGKNSTLESRVTDVRSKQQPDSNIEWLSRGLGTVRIPAILPGHESKVVQSAAIANVEAWFEQPEDDYNAQAFIGNVTVGFQNPYKFSLSLLDTALDATLTLQGSQDGAAHLRTQTSSAVNSSETSTGQVAYATTFVQRGNRLEAVSRPEYQELLRQLIANPEVPLTLSGTANATAKTASGNIPVPLLSVNVPSSLVGVQGFNGRLFQRGTPPVIGSGEGDVHQAAYPNGGSEWFAIDTHLTYNNPSTLSAHIANVSLDVLYNDLYVGKGTSPLLNIAPGNNTFHIGLAYMPENLWDLKAGEILTDYVTKPDRLHPVALGTSTSTPFECLDPAMESLHLNVETASLNKNVPADVRVFIDVIHALCTSQVTSQIHTTDPLESPLTLYQVAANIYQQGVLYANLPNQTIAEPITVQAGQTTQDWSSELFTVLPNGLIPAIPLLFTGPLGLDIDIIGNIAIQNYHIPAFTGLFSKVPYTIILTLHGLVLDLSIIQQVLTKPQDAIADLLQEIASLSECFGENSTILSNSYAGYPGSVSSYLSGSAGDTAGIPVSSIMSQIGSVFDGSPVSFPSVPGLNLAAEPTAAPSSVNNLAGDVGSGMQNAICKYLSFLCSAAEGANVILSKVVNPGPMSSALYGTQAPDPGKKYQWADGSMALGSDQGGQPVTALAGAPTAPWLTNTGDPNIAVVSQTPTTAPASTQASASVAASQPASQAQSQPGQSQPASQAQSQAPAQTQPQASAQTQPQASAQTQPQAPASQTQSQTPAQTQSQTPASQTQSQTPAQTQSPTTTQASTRNPQPTARALRRPSAEEYFSHVKQRRMMKRASLKEEARMPEWFDLNHDNVEIAAAYAGMPPETLLGVLRRYGIHRGQDLVDREIYEDEQKRLRRRDASVRREPWNFDAPLPRDLVQHLS